eukprot:scaffold71673_cov17-Prasinocladus_malaysianus.AAC.1
MDSCPRGFTLLALVALLVATFSSPAAYPLVAHPLVANIYPLMRPPTVAASYGSQSQQLLAIPAIGLDEYSTVAARAVRVRCRATNCAL